MSRIDMISGWISYFLTSGAMFYAGIAFIFIFTVIRFSKFTDKATIATISNLLFLIGTAMVIGSTTPIPVLMALFFGLSVVFYIIVDSSGKLSCLKRFALIILFISTSAAFISEIPYSVMPRFVVNQERVHILGDSLTAGLGEESVTRYPQLINGMKSIEIVDLSVPGSKMKDGIRMADVIGSDKQVVLLELGGNDWRIGGEGYAEEYERGFFRLMEDLTTRSHRVIMMEIPFPPFEYRLAYAQRRIAKLFDIVVIPKRVLSEILFLTPDSTSDGIHLTQKGHDAFAERLSEIIVRNFH